MKKEKIKVLIKTPGKSPRSAYISNTLANLQKTVGGYIECVTFAEDMVIICNEEGRLEGLPYNCNICGVGFVGTIIIAGTKVGEFTDIPVDYSDAKTLFKSLWEGEGNE